jgi:DNA-binding transcriptional MocR family regulator
MISFAGGIPAPQLFPYEEIEEAYHQLFRDITKRAEALQYSISEGYPPLRDWIVEGLRKQGLQAERHHVFIVNGSQQGLDFLGKLLINPGDEIAVENPSYLGAFQAFNCYQPRYLTVPTDDDGLRTDLLEPVFQKNPAMLYVMPNFQNPGGVTLTLERRQQLIALSHEYDIPVLEDDAYGQLIYEGEPLPTLQNLDAMARGGEVENGNVIYSGTFSKVLAPGFRVAWVVAPKAVVERLVLIKQAGDLHTSTINQMVVHELLQQDFMVDHIQKLRSTYRARRDAMLAALDTYFPDSVEWTRPRGGMFVWVRLPEGMNGTALLEESLEKIKVAFVPGEAFFADRTGKNTLRLNFSMMSPEQIEEGISKLGGLLTQKIPNPVHG